MSDYPTITQGKTRIPGINDGEEFEETDVSSLRPCTPCFSRVQSAPRSECRFLVNKSRRQARVSIGHVNILKARFEANKLIETDGKQSLWSPPRHERQTNEPRDGKIATNSCLDFRSFPPQQKIVSCLTISMTTLTCRKVKLPSPVSMMAKNRS